MSARVFGRHVPTLVWSRFTVTNRAIVRNITAARSVLNLGGVPLKASSEFRYLSVRIARQVVVVQPEAVDVQVPSQEDVLAPLALYVPAAQIALFAPPGRARTAPRARRPRPRLRLRESRMSRRAPRTQ